MTMSEEALDSALQVDTLLKATHFLDTFGSHVSNGRHLLGGVFFRTTTMTSESEVGWGFNDRYARTVKTTLTYIGNMRCGKMGIS